MNRHFIVPCDQYADFLPYYRIMALFVTVMIILELLAIFEYRSASMFMERFTNQ